MTDLAELSSRTGGLSDYLSLIRPANSIMVGFAVVVGIAVTSAGKDLLSLTTALGFVTGFAISSFSMITNDVYDVEVDRINQPSRPIPSGKIPLSKAKIFAVPFLVIGLISSIILGLPNFLIASIFALVGWYYDYRGKRYGLAGNSLVAFSLAIPYIFGSISLGRYDLNLAYLLALTSFLAGLGREVLKGIADVDGDRVRGIRSVAIVSGAFRARQLTAALFLSAVVSSFFPLILNLLGAAIIVYSILIIIPDAIFLFLAYRTLTMDENSYSLRLKQVALLGMLLGLVSYLVAGLLV